MPVNAPPIREEHLRDPDHLLEGVLYIVEQPAAEGIPELIRIIDGDEGDAFPIYISSDDEEAEIILEEDEGEGISPLSSDSEGEEEEADDGLEGVLRDSSFSEEDENEEYNRQEAESDEDTDDSNELSELSDRSINDSGYESMEGDDENDDNGYQGHDGNDAADGNDEDFDEFDRDEENMGPLPFEGPPALEPGWDDLMEAEEHLDFLHRHFELPQQQLQHANQHFQLFHQLLERQAHHHHLPEQLDNLMMMRMMMMLNGAHSLKTLVVRKAMEKRSQLSQHLNFMAGFCI
ncbi:acidic repeat-containing protein-like isoform X2 [Scomber scombrus]|uniref:Acidic repeat-containing protein-like isoform X2 n=1 Tax=Scomber scombrus TaxID=13677 RepID=A0AAV1Q4U0_SCOSC